MEKDELFYRLALSKVEGIGPIKYKKLIEQFGNASDVFKKKSKQLKLVHGLNVSNANAIEHFNEFDAIEAEVLYAEKNEIKILDFTHPEYPQRLKHCIDSPAILFYKGNANLNQERVVSIIGTRLFTDYGRRACEELIEQLKAYDVVVSSGLAFGIDAIAHKACVKLGVPTVGVIAHGLHTIYPKEHIPLTKDMMVNGGLLSEYFSHSKVDKGNFPTRNRIVAGMSDATIIIETDIRGGSMITAEIAYSYNRDVFCVPGRISDSKSNGCNYLIKSLKGQMITNAEDIANSLGWSHQKQMKAKQRNLFVELDTNEQQIVALLKTHEQMHIDELYLQTMLNSSDLASSLLSLEMQSIIKVKPGKIVLLID